MPRKLYGRDSVVLLVSRVYVCPQGHEIPAHDPRILNSLPNDKNIPFILSHKSGVTIGFMNQVNSLASSGMNFSEIEKYFAQHYYDRHWFQEKNWHDDLKIVKEGMSTDSPTIEDITQEHFPDPAEWHIIARSRLGVESALGLFTIFFYCWNERKEQKYPKGVITPISHYATKWRQSAFQPTSERFGLKCSASIPVEIKSDISQFLSAGMDVPELHSLLAQPGVSGSQEGTNNLQRRDTFFLRCNRYLDWVKQVLGRVVLAQNS